eukprot:CAMPEP_0114624118 /NCGR_PEP_ID=MMETSP0168-20121206/10607_1 /TAXON_ID=95228 ORGANISM="Vannella sp., Strain DIVA3 517/6/12" /NCGR_SAMPLE_ID=MMETSP0168 /ASSEMBLY_ACC=CAM_ASM_000044 /LENGTH=1083 /DNA_ID=CAMNT_0001835393 /DNA_START=34 /DNA_END=3282 /DNA_ORIENTATION=+
MPRKGSDWVSSTGYSGRKRFGARADRLNQKRGGRLYQRAASDKKKSGSSKALSKWRRLEQEGKTRVATRMVGKASVWDKNLVGYQGGIVMEEKIPDSRLRPDYVRTENGEYVAVSWDERGRQLKRELEEAEMEREKSEKIEKEAREAAWNAEAKVIARRLASECQEGDIADERFVQLVKEEVGKVRREQGMHLLSIIPYRLLCDMAERCEKGTIEEQARLSWAKDMLTTDVLWSSLLRLQNKEMRHWILQEKSLAVIREEAEAAADYDSSVVPVFSPIDGTFDRRFRRERLGWDALLHPHLIPPRGVLERDSIAGESVTLPNGDVVRPSVVPHLSHFVRNMEVFTNGHLRGVDLTGAFIGGSAVLACLQPDPPALARLQREIDEKRAAMMELPLPPEIIEKIITESLTESLAQLMQQIRCEQERLFKTSDVDIFVTAESEEEGLETATRLVTDITDRLTASCIPYFLLRTSNAVTICPGAPYRNIQVVLMLCSTIDEALCFCDLDCTALAFDGAHVYAALRSMRALNYRCNLVSPTASQRLGGPSRINKYIKRGFCALMFELCYHSPRCDVVPEKDVLKEFDRIETRRVSLYDDFLIHGTILEMLEHLERLRLEYLPEAAPFIVGESLEEIGFGEGELKGDPMEVDEIVTAIEQADLPSVRWKRTEILRRHQSFHLLPKCYQCGTRRGNLVEMDAGSTRTIIPLCEDCREFNTARRALQADMAGMTALVTGGRIKIGFATAVSLLKSGAEVIVTTRFPHDAAVRFSAEPTFPEWKPRLHIYGVDFRNLPSVQEFVSHLQTHYTHLEVLVNNAAQTIRRPPGYYRRLVESEIALVQSSTNGQLQQHLCGLVKNVGHNPHLVAEETQLLTGGVPACSNALAAAGSGTSRVAENALSNLIESDRYSPEQEKALFPADRVDEHGLQLDLRSKTSWNSTIEEVSVVEMAEVQMVNSVVPFILTQQLLPLLQRTGTRGGIAFVINVTSAEGQFSGGNKYGSRHPHTNMAKASLNMLTRTIAEQYKSMGIVVNSVDTGWVSQMQPAGDRSATAAVAPLGVEDGAARVLAPVYDTLLGNTVPHGVLLKDYK